MTHTTVKLSDLESTHITAYYPAPSGGSIIWLSFGPICHVNETTKEIDAYCMDDALPEYMFDDKALLLDE